MLTATSARRMQHCLAMQQQELAKCRATDLPMTLTDQSNMSCIVVPDAMHENLQDADAYSFFTKVERAGHKELTTITSDFKTAVTGPTRAISPVSDRDVSSKAMELVGALFQGSDDKVKKHDAISDTKAGLKEALSPAVFALTPGVTFSQAEKHHLACIKWTWTGTR